MNSNERCITVYPGYALRPIHMEDNTVYSIADLSLIQHLSKYLNVRTFKTDDAPAGRIPEACTFRTGVRHNDTIIGFVTRADIRIKIVYDHPTIHWIRDSYYALCEVYTIITPTRKFNVLFLEHDLIFDLHTTETHQVTPIPTSIIGCSPINGQLYNDPKRIFIIQAKQMILELQRSPYLHHEYQRPCMPRFIHIDKPKDTIVEVTYLTAIMVVFDPVEHDNTEPISMELFTHRLWNNHDRQAHIVVVLDENRIMDLNTGTIYTYRHSVSPPMKQPMDHSICVTESAIISDDDDSIFNDNDSINVVESSVISDDDATVLQKQTKKRKIVMNFTVNVTLPK